MLELEESARPSARADLYGGLFWMALGALITAGAWRMDRLERLGVSFYTAPGLMPGILGLLIIVFGVVLAARALREGALRMEQRPALLLDRDTLKRVGLTLGLSVGFAIVLVGHGLPFWVAAALYLFAQILVLQYPDRRAKGELAKGVAVAAAVAVGAAATIAFLFQHIFLVRLP